MTSTEQLTGKYAPTDIPFNLYKPAAPLKATLVENTKLTTGDSPNDVRHLVFKYNKGDYRYLDGQSAGILPPGEDANGRAHKIRLYSIASNSIGDDGQEDSFSLCVKRVVYTDEATGEEKRGVCSNHLCDLKVGEQVDVTGPTGKSFFLPPMENANIVMIATGTGIAPFRAFLKTRYTQRKDESGQTWMFFGAPYRTDYLYEEELEAYKSFDTYNLVTAFSREEKTADGRKVYVQDRLIERGAELFSLINQPYTYVYMCGLRGMESGVIEGLTQAAKAQGLEWTDVHAKLKAEHRWHVEVY